MKHGDMKPMNDTVCIKGLWSAIPESMAFETWDRTLNDLPLLPSVYRKARENVYRRKSRARSRSKGSGTS